MPVKIESAEMVKIVELITSHQTARIAGLSFKGNLMTALVSYNYEQACFHLEVRTHKGVKLFYTYEAEKAIIFLFDLIASDRMEKVQLIK